jgi:CheY-like chemotaxis protein
MELSNGPTVDRVLGPNRSQRLPRVLLAEDDPDTREALAEALEEAGLQVILARDGNELLNLLIDGSLQEETQRAYDAIVTDVVMPGFSGIDVLVALRRSTAFIPVIIVTGHVDPSTVRTAERLGVTALFRKPVDLNEVLKVLKTSLVSGLSKPRGALVAREASGPGKSRR